MAKAKRRQHTVEFKRKAVAAALAPHAVKQDIAKSYKIQPSVLHRWIQKYGAQQEGRTVELPLSAVGPRPPARKPHGNAHPVQTPIERFRSDLEKARRDHDDRLELAAMIVEQEPGPGRKLAEEIRKLRHSPAYTLDEVKVPLLRPATGL